MTTTNQINNNVFYTMNQLLDVINAGISNQITSLFSYSGLYYTGSNYNASSSHYYLNVTSSTSASLFSISYGDSAMTGSANSYLNIYRPAQAIYGQMKNTFASTYSGSWALLGSSSNVTSIIALTFRQTDFGDGIDVTNFTLNINGSIYTQYTGSKPTNYNSAIDANNITYIATGSNIVGMLFGKLGTVILDATKFSLPTAYDSRTYNSNFQKLLNVATRNLVTRGLTNYNSRYYICRIKNKYFNYSNNATFVDNNGFLKHAYMKTTSPTVYITAIGLYNSNNLLVAIAKPSKPIKKTFFNLATIQIKLDF